MSQEPSCPRRVFAVVLAAGESRRFGDAKLLARFDGEALVARMARLARATCGEHSVLVTGFRGADVAAAAGGHCATIIENPDYAEGLGSSIALAARTLSERADGILFLLADQPLIDAVHLRRLVAAWNGASAGIVATAFAGTRGPPVLMPRETFPVLARLSGDTGARALFEDARFDLQLVPFEDAAVDIDTPADLESLTRMRRVTRNVRS